MEREQLQVMIIGGGILEHALAWRLHRSPKIRKLFVAPGNAKISQIAECVDIDESNYIQLLKFARKEQIDLTIVGPYRLIAEGIADRFQEADLRIFAPCARDAEIGASRIVAKEMMRHYSIPTPAYHIFENIDGVLTYCEHARFPLVVKIDGTALAGTSICHSMDDVTHHLDKAMKAKVFGEAGERVIVEDFISGQIVSLPILLDRKTIIPFPGCQIIRELVDDNRVPIKLGAYSPAKFINKRVMHHIQREIIVPLVHAINRQSKAYRGFLTIDMVITDRGPRVLDFKIQWSDALAQVLLYQFDADFLELLLAILNGNPEKAKLSWNSNPIVGLIIAKDSYSMQKQDIELPPLPEWTPEDQVQIFCGRTRQQKGKTIALSDRLFGITSSGKTLEEANQNICNILSQMDLGNAFFKQYQA